MKNKIYHTVGTILNIPHCRNNSNIKIVESGKIDTQTNKYMATHFPALEQALQ